MASSDTVERSARADWTLMTAIHHALRRDLDELITTTAGPAAARAAGSYSATSCAATSPPVADSNPASRSPAGGRRRWSAHSTFPATSAFSATGTVL